VKPTVIQLTQEGGRRIWVSVDKIAKFVGSLDPKTPTEITLVTDTRHSLYVTERPSQVHALIEGQAVTGDAA